MSASIFFLIFSIIAIMVSMAWALTQYFIEPQKLFRIGVPIFVAGASIAALYSGILARSQQSQELAKLRPRSLSDSQRADFKKRFSKETPTIRIIYRLMDGEGKDYSDQIASAIRGAGGTVASVVGNSLSDLQGKVTVAVLGGDPKTMNSATKICDDLIAIGIPCGGEIAPGSFSGSPGPGEVFLIVGRRD
jgi:hypothetical protein